VTARQDRRGTFGRRQQGRCRPEDPGCPPGSVSLRETYRALRREGNSEEKSARIANAGAASSRQAVAIRGGRSRPYDDWTRKDLLQRAREIGIKGRSSMSKARLVTALRGH
jgi:hypothetical protein